MAIIAKRTVMSLYAELDDIYSHQVRIVLAEKGVNVEVIPLKKNQPSAELLDVNPYGTMPTLIDRDLVLYEARIIVEYLDERFPHPPLLPVYPVARAEARKMMYRIERDWYTLYAQIKSDDAVLVEQARERLWQSISLLEPVFLDKPFFLSDEYSLLDCALGPLLWRLEKLGCIVTESTPGLFAYMQRLFKRDSFQLSLVDIEKQVA